MKKQASTIPNVAPVPEATKASDTAPIMDMLKPSIIPFLNPILFRMSTPETADSKYRISDPKKYAP